MNPWLHQQGQCIVWNWFVSCARWNFSGHETNAYDFQVICGTSTHFLERLLYYRYYNFSTIMKRRSNPFLTVGMPLVVFVVGGFLGLKQVRKFRTVLLVIRLKITRVCGRKSWGTRLQGEKPNDTSIWFRRRASGTNYNDGSFLLTCVNHSPQSIENNSKVESTTGKLYQ